MYATVGAPTSAIVGSSQVSDARITCTQSIVDDPCIACHLDLCDGLMGLPVRLKLEEDGR